MNSINILLVEDDLSLGLVIRDYLELSGYQVFSATDGNEGLNLFIKEPIHLCILDVMLPQKDGLELAREIKKIKDNTPVVFLTAKSRKEDVIAGFKTGCDDYIVKPFSSEELSLRIEAILRRCRITEEMPAKDRYNFGDTQFDYSNLLLKVRDREYILTRKEADLLVYFCRHPKELLPREVILKAVWGDDDYFIGRSMDVFITRLRKYLKEEKSASINNIHGVGFVFELKDS